MKLHSSYLVFFDTPALERLASDCDFHTVPTIRGSLSLGKGKYLDGEGGVASNDGMWTNYYGFFLGSWMVRCLDAWMDGWMDGWMYVWMD